MEVNFVEIEPTNFCQNDCDFCRPGMTRPYVYLGLEKFKDIIFELSSMGFDGHICFAGLGEPMLHPDLFEMLKYIQAVLPRGKSILYTNGKAFNTPKFFEYLDGLVEFVVYNNYDDQVGRNLYQVYHEANRKPPIGVIDHVGGAYSFYNDRGGQPELSKYKRGQIDNPCLNFKHRLFLAAEGYFVTCCQDMKQIRKWKMGIKDLLENPEYQDLANKLNHSRGNVPLCHDCGVVMGTIYFPPPFPDRLVR